MKQPKIAMLFEKLVHFLLNHNYSTKTKTVPQIWSLEIKAVIFIRKLASFLLIENKTTINKKKR